MVVKLTVIWAMALRCCRRILELGMECHASQRRQLLTFAIQIADLRLYLSMILGLLHLVTSMALRHKSIEAIYNYKPAMLIAIV